MLLPDRVKPVPEGTLQPANQPSINLPIQHINCVAHEGKVVLVGTDAGGQLWYTVKQDGFENAYLETPEADRIGWEDWQLLELPNEEFDDPSVVNKENAELTDQTGEFLGKGQPLLRSRYRTHDQTAVAPVQLVSELGYVYVFRQAKSDNLLVDRFVLDGLTNRLNRKLDVRFKRSRQKHEPIQSQRKEQGSLLNVDALDFVDIQDKPFYEPTTELSLIKDLHQGWFAVVLLPTQEQDKYRWHIFTATPGSQIVNITTLRASEEGLFDLEDYTVLEPEPRRIAGIIQRKVNLGGAIAVDKGITATRYDIQRERETEAKDRDGNTVTQLIRESVRVMLVVGTSQGPAIALSFGVALDGTLSKIATEPPTSQICRSVTRPVLLPPNMLDDIRAIGRVREPRKGSISQLKAGEDNEVIVASSQTTALDPTEVMQIKVSGSRDYNGLHSGVKVIDPNTFEITLQASSQAGNSEVKWEEVLSADTGLLYNGMITACEMTAANQLKVTAFNHGLQDGDAVQIENTRAYDGTYTVSKVDDQTFCLEGAAWQSGTAINVKQQTEKRRGIVLDKRSHITLPPMNHDFSQGLTVEAWVYFDRLEANASIIELGNEAQADTIFFGTGMVTPGDSRNRKLADLALILRRDYDLKLIATGEPLPNRGNCLIAIARDDENPLSLSLKIFNAQGTVVFSHPETLLAGKASDQEALRSLLKSYWNIAKLLPADQKKIVEAVRAVLPTTPAIATQDEQTISSNTVLEAGKWMHLAATIDATGQVTLYKDGTLLKLGSLKFATDQVTVYKDGKSTPTDVLKLPPSLKRSQNYLGKSTFNPTVYWRGQLSQVRLWNRACSADEIRNGMMLPAREQAPGLVGDWRLDAIATGTQRTVVDFSINGNDGTVMGENAYINHSVVLPRNLKGSTEGSTIAVKRYENDDLFAVSERATYQEEFEFQLQLVEADGTVSTVMEVSGLTFIYKGKKNHSTQDWIPITAKSSPVTTSTDGWYKASCEFTVPDGMTLVRSFGIENIVSTQSWTQIEIRRHKITLVSDSITAETYNDTFTPGQLPIATAAALAQGDHWQKLTALEQAEANLLKQQQELEQAKRKNQSSPLSGAALSNEIAVSENRITELQNTVNRLQSEYDNLVNNSFNFWCYIVAKHSNRCIEAALNQWSNGASITQGSEFNDANKGKWATQWKFEPLGGDFYKIVNRYAGFNTDLCLHISGKNKSATYARIDQHTWADVNWQKWKVEKLNDGSYKILSKHDEGKGLDVSGIATHDGAVIQLFPNTDNAPSRTWWIRTGDALDNRVGDKRRELDGKKDELENEKKNLQQLNNRRDVDTKLQAVNDQLGIVQRDLQAELQNVLNDRKNAASVQMRSLPPDDHQLTTQVAVLDFVRPASRLSAIATCEGTVQLSYFDAQGRMRQTHFDATADRQNATFEEWIPDAQRTCLNFEAASSVVTLEKPINLDAEEWTVEAWFFYPFRAVDANLVAKPWAVLVGGDDQHQPLVVQDGEHLGSRLGDRFYSSGYSLKKLTEGGHHWHHITAVGKRSGTDSTKLLYYIDGEKVAETTATAALVLDGTGAFLDCGNKIDLNGKSFTIEFWAKRTTTGATETPRQNHFILSQGTEAANQGLHIGFRENDEFTFSFHGGNDLDTEPFTDLNWHHWACVYDAAKKKQQIYRDGQLIVERTSTANANYMGTGNLFVGKAWEHTKFNGQLNDLRIWNRPLTALEISTNWDKQPTADKDLLGWWQFSLKNDKAVVTDRSAQAAKATPNGNVKVEPSPAKIFINTIGNVSSGNQQAGKLAEIRVWRVALNPIEIAANRHTLLTGNEPDLIAYYPLNEGSGAEARNQTGDGNTGAVVSASWQACALPIGDLGDRLIQPSIPFDNNTGFRFEVKDVAPIRDALISCEYSTVSQDKSAMMRRFLAAPSPQGILVLPDKRIEQLELQWIGNGQFAPTLLGYIEGAPPIPSENLTLEDNYNGATSVELALSEDVEFKWTRTQESGLGASSELFFGADTESYAGLIGAQTKAKEYRFGYKGSLETNYQFQNESSITSKSSSNMTDKLQVSGTQEQEAHFPHLGKRFIPKNVGYALVVSALADVFVTRLQRTGRMIGYQVLPVDGIPLDVNTITFLINPAYTMSGSLDGLTGSSPTSQRFFKHVPEMRSRFGSLYPASYYRLKEAYDLKQKIDQQDKSRESYFAQFNSRLVDETSLGREIDQGEAPESISVSREEDKPDDSLTEEQKKAAEAENLEKQKQEASAVQAKRSEAVKKKQAEINEKLKDPNLQANASASFARWQKRMETIQIRSGKRNIVNTYVWDADGGLRAEAQSFANTAEHSIGGSFNMNASGGIDSKFGLFGLATELTAQATVSLTQTMSKTETRSKGIQLNVDLSGVESRGITNHDDLPLLAGEKVNRYRFMSFYLEGSTNHFYDFFSYVVDPEWLAGNSEEARALRQAKGKANKAWRVLHRVTYVERPALAGFGRDVRQLPPAISEEEQQIALLKEKVETLEDKIDEILQLLQGKT